MYIFARIVLGFGIPTCIVSGSSLIGELGYPKERAILTSLFNVSYFVGQIAAAGITFGTNSIPTDWAWRIPSLLQMVPSLMQIAFIFFLPESPRWLIGKGRSAEANDILVKYHAEGNQDSEFVRAEMAQIQTTIELEVESSRKSWLSLFSTAGMRRRTLISTFLGLFTQWSGNTLISYYLGDLLGMIGHTDSVFKQKINVASACWNLVCGVTIAMLVNRFNRRAMYLTCTISLLVVYICWTVSMEKSIEALDAGLTNSAAGAATIFFIFAYAPAYNIGYNALTYTYLVELWPYAERSRGISHFQLFGRLAGFFTTFVNPIGLDNISWKWLITYCCWLAFEICFVWFLFPETAGRTLEELAFCKAAPLPLATFCTSCYPVLPLNIPLGLITNAFAVQCSKTKPSQTRRSWPSRKLCTMRIWGPRRPKSPSTSARFSSLRGPQTILSRVGPMFKGGCGVYY